MEKVKRTGAVFNYDRTHRIALWRIWDETKPTIMFVGLNPSTANEGNNDPTVSRVMAIAKELGFGGVYMMNLFTFVSTDPAKLNIEDGNHYLANKWLIKISRVCAKIVFAWGNFKVHGRDAEVAGMFQERFALQINKNGSPKHPLYCKIDTQLIVFP